MATQPCKGRSKTTGTPADMLAQARTQLFLLLSGQQPLHVETPQLGAVQFVPTTGAKLQTVIEYLEGLVEAGNVWPPDGSTGNMLIGRGRKPFSFFAWP